MDNFRLDIITLEDTQNLRPGEVCAVNKYFDCDNAGETRAFDESFSGSMQAATFARYVFYRTTRDDAGMQIKHVLRHRIDASVRSVKRAKVAGGDAIAFCEQYATAQTSVDTDAYFIKDGIAAGIILDWKRVRTNFIVGAGQLVGLLIDDAHLGLTDTPFPATQGTIDIIYEDDDLLLLRKAAGQLMYPSAAWHEDDTLANFVVHYFKNKNFVCDLHPVHRLDRDTSGIVIFAKNAFTQDRLQNRLHAQAGTFDFARFDLPSPKAGTFKFV